MKKIIFALMCLSILSLGNTSNIQAASTLKTPKTISIGDAVSYSAGQNVQMTMIESDRSVGSKNIIEYGIARVIKNSQFNSFEIITRESKDITNATVFPALSFAIPNPLSALSSSSVYVAYIQYSEKNNQGNISQYTSKEFSIIPNNTPFIKVKNINLLSSNGRRFAIKEGPSIYTPAESAQIAGTATSTSLEITFESNQEMVLNPSITFSKIRSDVFSQKITLDPISVKKGETYIKIPLPTFDYVPGVYVGQLTFGNANMKTETKLQYIIAGNAVTVGNVTVVPAEGNDSLKFEIFGTPLDFERFNSTSTVSEAPTEVYKVTTTYKNLAGKTLFSTTQDVDFANQEFSVEIPKKYKKIESVDISVASPTTGAVLFETTRNIAYVNPEALSMNLIIYIFLYTILFIVMFFSFFKGHIKTAIVCIVVLIGLFFARDVFATMINAENYRDKTAGNSQTMGFGNEGHYILPLLLVDDEVFEPSVCGEPVKVKFAVYYFRCTNSVPTINVGFSRVNYLQAFNSSERIGLGDGSEKREYARNGEHIFYEDISDIAEATIAAVPQKNSMLYGTVDTQAAGGGGNNTQGGFTRYQLPLTNTCGDQPPACSCSGRNKVCTTAGMATTTSVNDASCSLQASCSVSRNGTTASFNTIVTNALGSVVYKDVDSGQVITNPYQREVVLGATIVQKTLVTDTDGATATATCTVTNDGSISDCPNGNCPTTPPCTGANCPTGTTTSTSTPRKPTIVKFKPRELVVPRNRACQYSWTVTDVDRCALRVNNTSILLQGNGLTGPIDVSAADGNNQRAVLTCVAEDLPADEGTISTSTLCQVLPEVIEN